mmetsp:Transcript_24768/g.44859  ORF Transcript_24768/g.44859 Transcript_24768/m.44859 type:complete len:89 (-) Transcript_24768:1528-1794(-)
MIALLHHFFLKIDFITFCYTNKNFGMKFTNKQRGLSHGKDWNENSIDIVHRVMMTEAKDFVPILLLAFYEGAHHPIGTSVLEIVTFCH